MKRSFLAFSALFALTFCSTIAFADAVTLQSLVDAVNSQNDGAGLNVLYASGNAGSAVGRTNQHAIGFTDADAAKYLGAYLSPVQLDGTWEDHYDHTGNLIQQSYNGGDRLFINSFCAEVQSRTIDNTYVNAQLSFVDNGDGTYKTIVDATGVYGDGAMASDHALTLGAALMYQAWLVGDLDRNPWNQAGVSEGWRENSSLINRFGEYDIQAAIWAFQGNAQYDNYTGTGSTEGYLEHAIAFLEATYGNMFGDDEWWLQDYDPVNHSVDGYSVLVMNLFANDGLHENGFQDHVILVPNTPTATPEPGTLAIFGIGLASILGLRRRKTV